MAPVEGSGSWPACTHTVLNRAFEVSFTIPVRYSVSSYLVKAEMQEPINRARSFNTESPQSPNDKVSLR